MTLRRALFGFIAVSCLFLLIELIDSHRGVENPVTWVPLVVTSLAVAASLVAFLQWRRRPARLALQGAGVLLILAGLLGFFLHTGGDFGLGLEVRQSVPTERDGAVLYVGSQGAVQRAQALDEKDEEGEDEGEAPPLAPLSLVGVGILSLMATSLGEESAHEAAAGQG